jgi:aryl-alcohol dehydrogenase-like predicted oxidoreductase
LLRRLGEHGPKITPIVFGAWHCLAATFAEPGITAAIAGARDASQAVENAAAMEIALRDDERATIRAVFEAASPTRRRA